jgi:hypothetical protein
MRRAKRHYSRAKRDYSRNEIELGPKTTFALRYLAYSGRARAGDAETAARS